MHGLLSWVHVLDLTTQHTHTHDCQCVRLSAAPWLKSTSHHPLPSFPVFLAAFVSLHLALIFLSHLFCIMTPPLPPLLFTPLPPPSFSSHWDAFSIPPSRAEPCPRLPLCTHIKPRCIRLPVVAVTYMIGRRPASVGNVSVVVAAGGRMLPPTPTPTDTPHSSSGGIQSPSRSSEDGGRNYRRVLETICPGSAGETLLLQLILPISRRSIREHSGTVRNIQGNSEKSCGEKRA